jgi:general L-amino acid transport system permease protein
MTQGSRRQERIPLWRDTRVIGWVTQAVIVAFVVAVAWFLLSSLLDNLAVRGLLPSFGFLGTTAGFDIGESLIEYDFTDTYGHALFVGLINTLLVSFLGVVLATILGLIFGVARLSNNWLVAKVSLGYVELFRNTPLLLQLFVIYFAVFLQLPGVRDAIRLPGEFFISQRGLYFPRPVAQETVEIWSIVVLAAIGLAALAWLRAGRLEAAGRPTHHLRWVAGFLLVGLPILGWVLVGQAPFENDYPELGRFNFSGGASISPEFGALMFGLALYTGAFIAEIVRGGIQAVSQGQHEAARAIGLTEGQVLRLIVLPQALRVIIPPLTSQYLNLVKNSSLAIAIAYSDVFNVSNTVINQTGQSIAVIMLVMGVYLVISLLTSLVMNIYNRSVQIQQR